MLIFVNFSLFLCRYDSFARRELPVNPKICRIRTDLQWPDVLSDSGNLFFSGMPFPLIHKKILNENERNKNKKYKIERK